MPARRAAWRGREFTRNILKPQRHEEIKKVLFLTFYYGFKLSLPLNPRSQRTEFLVYAFVAAVNVIDAIYGGLAVAD